MSATIDLLLLRIVPGAEEVPLYEPAWIIPNYISTYGLWRESPETKELVLSNEGVGAVFDGMFGDGPKRNGLTSLKPLMLVTYTHGKQSAFDFVRDQKSAVSHAVVRSPFMEHLCDQCAKKNYQAFQAFSLVDFLPFLERIQSQEKWEADKAVDVAHKFLFGLERSLYLVFPVMGLGMRHYYDDIPYSNKPIEAGSLLNQEPLQCV